MLVSLRGASATWRIVADKQSDPPSRNRFMVSSLRGVGPSFLLIILGPLKKCLMQMKIQTHHHCAHKINTLFIPEGKHHIRVTHEYTT